MDSTLLKIEIKYEHDVVLSRRRARHISQLLGYDTQEQVRIATAVSELARNVFQYAKTGKVEFSLTDSNPCLFKIRVSDSGPGISNLSEILAGRYVSKTGMGVGLTGARKLVDGFEIQSGKDQGTIIELLNKLPKRAPATVRNLSIEIARALAKEEAHSPFEEIQHQNQELLAALEEVERQKALLTKLNQELGETNKGVVALSAELEQRADYQKRSSEIKTEFLSTITHELRTPLNSIISISSILLDRMDGDLNQEQEKQIKFIASSAKSLSELVNDVLDLAKVEAGKINIRRSDFEISEVFRVLTGMLKPLIQPGSPVKLVFDEPHGIPLLSTDEAKVSQILRNFISNSLKYTEQGEVRVSAKKLDDDKICISVQDTGMGIAPENLDQIFEDFMQVEGAHQQNVKGTGLGLPLSRRLAHLLGGQVLIESSLGHGSIFSLVLPIAYRGLEEVDYSFSATQVAQRNYKRILIIDDQLSDRSVLKKLLSGQAEQILEASSGVEGLAIAKDVKPCVVFLDLSMSASPGEEILEEFSRCEETRNIPIVIQSSKDLSEIDRKKLLMKAFAVLSKSLSQKERAFQINKTLQDIREISHG